jgi:NADPH-dependent curcumin reductase CurA
MRARAIVEDYSDFAGQMNTWFQGDMIKFREDIMDGLQKAHQVFIGMLEGKNFGERFTSFIF